ncbi:transcription initiation factor TFIID subunit 4 isoform X1 [Pongo pygmaeus]|uniref:transcription initiation factor TFIID subunit 4 isoform X1 n=1 Tax=Pongo pygmaeus TaxID=9600 RepID=UPI0023E120DD|nr:transcription initiation factor TFIID subunit 4 isoform X1 [Pongo pygmaeus]
MAAGSDLLDEVFFNSEVDEKVVSDLVGSLESQLAASAAHHHHLAPRTPEVRAAAAGALGNHVVSGSPAGAAGAGPAAPAEGAPGAAPEPPPAGRARPGGGGPRRPGPPSPRRPLVPAGPAPPAAKLRPPPEGSTGACAPVPAAAAVAAGPEPAPAGPAKLAGPAALAARAGPGPGPGPGPGKPAGPGAAQTLNGSAALLNSHHAAAPAVSLVNNGPAALLPLPKPAAPGTVIQTPPFVGAAAPPAPAAPSPPAAPAPAAPAAAPPPPPPAPATLARPPGHPAGPPTAAPAAPPPAAAQNGGSAGAAPAPAPAAGCPAGVSGQPGPGAAAAAPAPGVKAESPKTVVQAAPPAAQTLAASGPASTAASMVIGPTMQGALPSPAAVPPPAPGTPTGLPKGAAGAVTQSLPRTPTATTSGIRATLTPTVLAPRLPQPPQNPTNIQNFQLPPGMVLVRSENGQLLMIPQQALAQMQAQAHAQPQTTMAPRPATPTSAPPVQISTVQAPGTPIIARQVTPTTIIKQVSQAQTTVQPSATLQRSPGVQPQLVLGGAAQTASLGTATAVQTGTPQRTVPGATTTSSAATETMENVKKCKNFLSTLIKLASSGKQSTETAANVKELVQNLLDGKIEAEDFTSRLYRELNSSPQPYLVPFLKRSLPALRQLTPDSAAFIQQSQQQPPPPASQATTALTAVVLSSSVQRTAGKTAATVTSALQPPVLSLTQPTQVGVGKQGQPTPLVIQQPPKPGALIRPPQVTLTQTPMVALRQPHNRIMLTTPQQIQLNPLQPVPVVKPAVLPGTKALSAVSAQAAAAQKNKLKEPGGGSFRDDDDINDVASMAGVNLSEESARILATNSELVGTLTRSCKDETFLLQAPLQRRILEIGKKHGITELHPDVVSYVSHATQQRLQNLVEKISETAQQKNFSYKDDDRYEQASDVRAQLKFFEQLDQIEKQRKDEQEREILMRAAKSRSRQEDPEQLRLKQKAKEMQQQELAQMRQRDANLTALAAIGPRKKRKVDCPGPGSGAEGSGPGSVVPGSSGVGTPRQFTRQRITRVNLRDLIFCLENERETSHSLLLYKAFLK